MYQEGEHDQGDILRDGGAFQLEIVQLIIAGGVQGYDDGG